jgi:hypothetical protein
MEPLHIHCLRLLVGTVTNDRHAPNGRRRHVVDHFRLRLLRCAVWESVSFPVARFGEMDLCALS